MVSNTYPYKDNNSLIIWQANMCSYIATTELCQRRYVVVLESVSTYFIVHERILLFVALVEILGLQMLLYCL
jgi:hypothetical protein